MENNIKLYYLTGTLNGAYCVIDRESEDTDESIKKIDKEMSENNVFCRRITKEEAIRADKYLGYLESLLHNRRLVHGYGV